MQQLPIPDSPPQAGAQSKTEVHRRDSIQIFAKMPNGRKILLDVRLTDRCEDVKRKIQDRQGIPADECYLGFDSRRLMDDCTLQDYGISRDSMVTCCIQWRARDSADCPP
jgi:hypothetical protein